MPNPGRLYLIYKCRAAFFETFWPEAKIWPEHNGSNDGWIPPCCCNFMVLICMACSESASWLKTPYMLRDVRLPRTKVDALTQEHQIKTAVLDCATNGWFGACASKTGVRQMLWQWQITVTWMTENLHQHKLHNIYIHTHTYTQIYKSSHETTKTASQDRYHCSKWGKAQV